MPLGEQKFFDSALIAWADHHGYNFDAKDQKFTNKTKPAEFMTNDRFIELNEMSDLSLSEFMQDKFKMEVAADHSPSALSP